VNKFQVINEYEHQIQGLQAHIKDLEANLQNEKGQIQRYFQAIEQYKNYYFLYLLVLMKKMRN